jgi:hypothetical protein
MAASPAIHFFSSLDSDSKCFGGEEAFTRIIDDNISRTSVLSVGQRRIICGEYGKRR